MIVNEKLIYLMMQKTGCSHIAKLILQTVGGERIGTHNKLTDYNTGKYIIGSIRNPWDWYVSLWAYGCRGKGRVRRFFEDRIRPARHMAPCKLSGKIMD
jgi:hypothetical protein